MTIDFAVDLLCRGLLAPAGVAAIILALARLCVPERYAAPIAFASAVMAGYLLMDWAKIVPERHFQWLPWLPVLSLIPLAAGLAQGVGRIERLATLLVPSAISAWLLVPTWSRLEETRGWWLLAVFVGLVVLGGLLDVVAARSRPIWFCLLQAGFLAAQGGMVMAFISLKYGQMVLVGAGAAAGVAILSARRDAPVTSRALAPHLGLFIGAGAFLPYVEQDPPLSGFLLPLAAPLVLLPFCLLSRKPGQRSEQQEAAPGRIAKRKSPWPVLLQAIALIALLGASAAWVHTVQSDAAEYDEYSY